jgi:hypothetical protein
MQVLKGEENLLDDPLASPIRETPLYTMAFGPCRIPQFNSSESFGENIGNDAEM